MTTSHTLPRKGSQVLGKARSRFQHSAQWLFSSPLHLLVVVGTLAPILLVLIDIAQNSTNAPFYDQWYASYPIAVGAIDGSLTIDELFQFHNVHRILFTNVVTALSAIFLHWNIQVELVVTVLLAGGILLVLVLVVRRDYPRLALILAIPYAALVFSLRGRRTWLTSFQSCFVFAALFFVLALWILSRPPSNRRLVLAAILACCANFSMGSGLLAWPILLIALPLLGYRKWYQLLFWIIAGTLSNILYFQDFFNPWAEPFTPAVIPEIVRYMLAYLGAPFVTRAASSLGQATLIGGISVALCLASVAYLLWHQRSLKRLVVWGALAGFGLGTAAITAYGRAGIVRGGQLGQALSEQYIIHAIFWWVAVITLSAAAIDDVFRQGRLPARLFAAASLIVMVALILLGVFASSYTVLVSPFVPKEGADCTIQTAIFPASGHTCFDTFHVVTFTDRSLPVPARLADRGLTIFSGPLPDISLIKMPFEALRQPEPPSERPAYTTVQIGETEVPALFEHASALIEYQVHLPAAYTHASFHARVYVDPQNLERDPATPQDGVTFTFAALDDVGNTLISEPLVFDPNIDKDPVPVTWDLSQFAGQTIRLQLGTDARQNGNWDWAYWIEPALTITSD